MIDRLERPPRLLLANHHTSPLPALEPLLAERGYVVEATAHLVETVSRLASDPPDVVVFQPLTSHLDGFEIRHVLESGGEERNHAVVLVLAEPPQGALVDPVRLTVFDDFVNLPCPTDELLARIELAVARSRRFKELSRAAHTRERDSVTDYKTGLWNDRFFFRRLGVVVARSRRHHLAVALLLLDLDHFKTINDQFDHLFGDHVLFAFAQKLRALVRQIDLAARLGGDEFALLLPNTDLEEATLLATRLRTTVAAHSFEKDGHSARLTLSIGIAALQGDEPLEPEQFLRRADNALIEAKRRGRNRICLWPEVAQSSEEEGATTTPN
jgi:two-component system cell cycle response regulator